MESLKIGTQQVAAWLCFAGSFLIFLNVAAIAFTGFPIIISSGQPPLDLSSRSYYRISFGISYLLQGYEQILTWLFLAALNFALATSIALAPERPRGSIFVLALSILLFLTGGGFILGSILAIIGSISLIQRRQLKGEDFARKILRALRLDSSLFREIKEKEESHNQAALIIVIISFLIGLGSGIYAYNANRILKSVYDAKRILLLGDIFFDVSIFAPALTNISLGFIKWITFSIIIYIVGSRIMGVNTEFKSISIPVAYAHVPLALQVFLPVILSNEPILTTNWPIAISLITDLWFFLALVIAVKECFNVGMSRALGVVIFSGSLYWLFIYRLILPTLFVNTPPPGIYISIQSNELIFLMISASIIVSYLLGTFRKM